MAAELGKDEAPELDGAAEAELQSHDWPGNIRELRNVVERAVIHGIGGKLAPWDLNPLSWSTAARPPGQNGHEVTLPVDLNSHLEDVRGTLFDRALKAARHNQRKAAALLGLRYDQFRSLYRRLRKGPEPDAGADQEAV
jgi:psp operon transcriptional activator